MPVFFASLISMISGLANPFKDWANYKMEEARTEREISLATLKAQAEQIAVQAESDAIEVKYRLGATTQEFKQNTFWFLCVPVLFTVCFPKHAAVMWQNFNLIPNWVQILFQFVYGSIWGIPLTKQGYGAFTDLLSARQDYNVAKVKALNEAKIFESLRQSIFTHGLTQQQVNAVQAALKAGQDG